MDRKRVERRGVEKEERVKRQGSGSGPREEGLERARWMDVENRVPRDSPP
jgi:hypothetical protein